MDNDQYRIVRSHSPEGPEIFGLFVWIFARKKKWLSRLSDIEWGFHWDMIYDGKIIYRMGWHYMAMKTL